MKKIVFIIAGLALFACNKESNNYVTVSGKITDKFTDSIIIRSYNYSKTIKLNSDGSFKDTLKIDAGIYNLFDGNESAAIYLKNGFDLQITLDTKQFDETINFKGIGAEHSNFLAKNALKQETLLNLDVLSKLSLKGLEEKLNEIKIDFTNFYNSNKNIDTLIINKLSRDLDPMLNMYKNYLAESIALKESMPIGSPSPKFENYENYNGSKTSLSDLKGKYVYIDVWATWCGPCKAEIPSLKLLEKKYHGKNIQFLSLSIDDDRSHGGSWDKARSDWKNMVSEKELGGIQLFAPNGWLSQFVVDYKIKGIPRFILIDPDGNVVTPDAPRPSEAGLIELFTSLNI